MIELCFVVPVAMLTRKIPSNTPELPQLRSVGSHKFCKKAGERERERGKTCCWCARQAYHGHILSICYTRPPLSCFLPACVCCTCSICFCFYSFFAHFSQFVAPGFGLASDLTQLGSLLLLWPRTMCRLTDLTVPLQPAARAWPGTQAA